ncbi:MAG: hypothetical protein H7A36_05905 [Chlamydiales bacterium]|nr:hypothetical protein [Chlamydiales bacterium]
MIDAVRKELFPGHPCLPIDLRNIIAGALAVDVRTELEKSVLRGADAPSADCPLAMLHVEQVRAGKWGKNLLTTENLTIIAKGLNSSSSQGCYAFLALAKMSAGCSYQLPTDCSYGPEKVWTTLQYFLVDPERVCVDFDKLTSCISGYESAGRNFLLKWSAGPTHYSSSSTEFESNVRRLQLADAFFRASHHMESLPLEKICEELALCDHPFNNYVLLQLIRRVADCSYTVSNQGFSHTQMWCNLITFLADPKSKCGNLSEFSRFMKIILQERSSLFRYSYSDSNSKQWVKTAPGQLEEALTAYQSKSM